jgi:hypothetical protein
LPVPGLIQDPTAVHAASEVHDTAARLACVPLGLGVAWIAHAVPSQTSANVFSLKGPVPIVNESPTAMHASSDVHDTANSTLSGLLGG